MGHFRLRFDRQSPRPRDLVMGVRMSRKVEPGEGEEEPPACVPDFSEYEYEIFFREDEFFCYGVEFPNNTCGAQFGLVNVDFGFDPIVLTPEITEAAPTIPGMLRRVEVGPFYSSLSTDCHYYSSTLTYVGLPVLAIAFKKHYFDGLDLAGTNPVDSSTGGNFIAVLNGATCMAGIPVRFEFVMTDGDPPTIVAEETTSIEFNIEPSQIFNPATYQCQVDCYTNDTAWINPDAFLGSVLITAF